MPFQGIRKPLFNPQNQQNVPGQAPQNVPNVPGQAAAQQAAAQQQQQLPAVPLPPNPPVPAPATLQQLLDNQQHLVDFMAKFGAFVQQDKDDGRASAKQPNRNT